MKIDFSKHEQQMQEYFQDETNFDQQMIKHMKEIMDDELEHEKQMTELKI